MAKIELTEAEVIFVTRMVPHFAAGKSFEEAARAVLEDDKRLFDAAFDKNVGKGEVIVNEMARNVYTRLRAA